MLSVKGGFSLRLMWPEEVSSGPSRSSLYVFSVAGLVPFSAVSWKGNGGIGVAAGWWEIRFIGRGVIWIMVGIFWEMFCIPCARKTCLFWGSTVLFSNVDDFGNSVIYLISCPSKPFLFIFTQLQAYHDTMSGLNPLEKNRSCEKERVDLLFEQSGCCPVWGQ